nr:aminodeoxychorismate/anthranilate synthase component II [Lachnospiraceae bacterium]
MTLLIDNYDSFSYNLYQAVGVYDADIKVVKNDEIKVEDIKDMNPDRIILSPGPGRPENAGICEEVVKEYSGKVPILGVCLGHQAICEAFGSKINYAKELMHGKSSEVKLDTNASLFTGIDRYETVGRYHSLAVDEENLSASLKVVARADDGQIMAVKHKQHDTYGLQFHPESILTPSGDKIVKNFIK